MSFDPYYEWLGIPPDEQPPNLYQLLGLRAFESNPTVIENAADRQMVHLRGFQHGPRSANSQRLLNEVSQARVCLLDSARKLEYDAALRAANPVSIREPQQNDPQRPLQVPATALPLQPQAIPIVQPASEMSPPESPIGLQPLEPQTRPTPVQLPVNRRTGRHKQGFKMFIELAKIIAGGVAGTVGAMLILWYGFGLNPLGVFPDPKPEDELPAEVSDGSPPIESTDSTSLQPPSTADVSNSRSRIVPIRAATNPGEELVRGKYLCWAEGKWKEGLPRLAASQAHRIRAAAQADLQTPDDAAAMVKSADTWGELAQSDPSLRAFQRRADYWYFRALLTGPGYYSARAEKHLTDDGFTSLFDGTSLRGWHAGSAVDSSLWRAEQGMIVVRPDRHTQLITDRSQFTNFVLLLHYRLVGGVGNVAFRGSLKNGLWDYRVTLDSGSNPGNMLSLLAADASRGGEPRTVASFRSPEAETRLKQNLNSGGWNQCRIEAIDDEIHVAINGETLYRARQCLKKFGPIHLAHSGSGKLEVKNLYVKDLPD